MSKWDLEFKIDGAERTFDIFIGLWWLLIAAAGVALMVVF